jgi:hypothetical protein
MSPEEQDRIDDQIAEARETIQRERDEYEDRQEQERRREQYAAEEQGTDHGTAASSSGKNHVPDVTHSSSAANGATNGGGAYKQDQEMRDEDSREAADVAIEPQHTEEPAMDTQSLEPEANADEPSKDNDEEVVEAAEDTVIY